MKSRKIISILSLFLISFESSSKSVLDVNLNLNIEEKNYTKDVNALFLDSIKHSYKVLGQKYVIESEKHLWDIGNYYYMPSVSITSQVKSKFDRPGHPSPFPEFTLDLTARMKLWSNATADKKGAAFYSLLAAKEKYNEIINDVYSRVKNNLLKIEHSRSFLAKSQEYRKRMDFLQKQMEISATSGMLKESDKIFAEVTVKKFEQSVLNVLSQIEQYKNQINDITPYQLYDDSYGLSAHYVSSAMSIEPGFFNIDSVMAKNFSVLSKKADLLSEKKRAKSVNEFFKVELVTAHNIKENKESSKKNDQNQTPYGYTYDDDGDSYIGVQFTYSGLNYGSYKSQMSEYELYKQKTIELDEYIHGLNVELSTLKEQFNFVYERIENINSQIELTADVIGKQMKELAVDESSVLDIFRNISSLSDLEVSYLTAKKELVDIVTRVHLLNSTLPSNYVVE